MNEIQYCIKCGCSVVYRKPPSDTKERAICSSCSFIQYENPRVVVGAVCMYDNKTLMCLRDIEPRKGFWTIPAGFLELNESTEQGAVREAKEEALASIEITRTLAIFNIPRVAQVQIIYLANILNGDFGVGEETSSVELCSIEEALSKDIAFPNVVDSLRQAQKVLENPSQNDLLQKTYL